MSATLDESAILQAMPVAGRLKQYKALLGGKSVPGQNGMPVEIPGLDEQYIENQSAVEGQRLLVAANRAALDAEKAANSGDPAIEQELAKNLRGSIVNLALMENQLEILGERITTIRRRITELEAAGTT